MMPYLLRVPPSDRALTDHDFPPSLARRWKKSWLQPRNEDAQIWVTMAHPTTQVRSHVSARGTQQRVCKPTPRMPQTRPARRRGSRFGRGAPTRADSARVVRWIGRRGLSLPSNRCVLLEAGERREKRGRWAKTTRCVTVHDAP